MCHGIVEIIHLKILKRQVTLRKTIIGIDRDGPFEGVERVTLFADRVEGAVEIAPSIGVARVSGNVDAELIGGFHVAAEREQLEAKYTAKLWQIVDCRAQVLDLLITSIYQLQLRCQITMRTRVWRPAVEHGLPKGEPRAIFRVALIGSQRENDCKCRNDDIEKLQSPVARTFMVRAAR